MKMKIKVKKLHKDAKLPYRQYEGDACYDLYAVEDIVVKSSKITKVRFGISWEIPKGYEAVVRGRSSSFVNKKLHVFVGTVDQQYRGEIICAVVLLFQHWHDYKIHERPDGQWMYDGETHEKQYLIKKGEAIAQVAFRKVPEFDIVEVDELSKTYRNTNGFGSTG